MMAEALLRIVQGIPATLALTAVAFAAGCLLGLPLFMLRTLAWTPLRWIAGALILAIRSIPPIVWLFIVYFSVGSGFVRLDPFSAAALGLSIITAANMAEIYRGAAMGIPRGQDDAVRALGFPAWSAALDILGPQMLRIALPAMATYAIGLLKDTSVASVLGVQEISFLSHSVSQQTFRGIEIYSVAAVIYVALSIPVAVASRVLDSRLRMAVLR